MSLVYCVGIKEDGVDSHAVDPGNSVLTVNGRLCISCNSTVEKKREERKLAVEWGTSKAAKKWEPFFVASLRR